MTDPSHLDLFDIGHLEHAIASVPLDYAVDLADDEAERAENASPAAVRARRLAYGAAYRAANRERLRRNNRAHMRRARAAGRP